MLGASTQRAGLLAPSGLTTSRHQLRGSKLTAFPNGANNRNRSHHLAHRSSNQMRPIKAIAEADKSASNSAGTPSVVIDNTGDKETLLLLKGQNRPGKCAHQSLPEDAAARAPSLFLYQLIFAILSFSFSGLLASLATIFSDLGLDVVKADIGSNDSGVADKFWLRDISTGGKIADADLASVQSAVEVSLATHAKSGNIRPKLKVAGATAQRAELLHTLMGKIITNS